jgi:hypothetical protein
MNFVCLHAEYSLSCLSAESNRETSFWGILKTIFPLLTVRIEACSLSLANACMLQSRGLYDRRQADRVTIPPTIVKQHVILHTLQLLTKRTDKCEHAFQKGRSEKPDEIVLSRQLDHHSEVCTIASTQRWKSQLSRMYTQWLNECWLTPRRGWRQQFRSGKNMREASLPADVGEPRWTSADQANHADRLNVLDTILHIRKRSCSRFDPASLGTQRFASSLLLRQRRSTVLVHR